MAVGGPDNPADSGHGTVGREEMNVGLFNEGVTWLCQDEGKETPARIPGGLVTCKVTAEQTSGAYSLFEVTIQPGEGIPTHIEHREDECVYIVTGEFEVLTDDEVSWADAGSLVYISSGTVHGIRNVGKTTGKILDIFTPGGPHDAFFDGSPEEAPNGATITTLANGYGMGIPPPPLE